MAVSFKQLLETFELMGMANPLGECEAILCKQTGKIYYRSDSPEFAEFGDELPDDIGDGEKYIVLPDKRELDLGKALVLDFARESCLTTSMKSAISSASAVLIRNSRPC